jgi:stage IV sporulation protein FB
LNNFFHLFRSTHIHPLLWAILAIGIMTGHIYDLILLFSLVLLHELGHVFAASFFSWKIKKIMLFPFGGVAEIDEYGNRPLYQEVIVILSGPFVHLILMLGSFIALSSSLITHEFYEQFMFHNVLLLCFNLLPIYPLDGGKLMFVSFSLFDSFQKSFEKTLRISAVFLLCIAVVALFLYSTHLHLWMVLCYLCYSLYYEWKQRDYLYIRFLLDRYYGKGETILDLSPLAVNGGEKIYHIIRKFKRGQKHIIIVEEKEGRKQLDENELLHAYFVDKRTNDSIDELVAFY